MKEKLGFTLIETLLVVFVLGIVLVIGGGLFFNIMKASTKVEVEKEVKQNGEYTLAIMERIIRNSSNISLCGWEELVITNQDGELTKFRLVTDGDVDKIASSSGSPGWTTNLFLTGDGVFASRDADGHMFYCYDSQGDECYTPACTSEQFRRVKINFSLSPKGSTRGASETYAEIQFQTSISLRNFPR